MTGVNPLPSWTRPFLIVSIFVLAFNNLWNHSFIYADTFNLFAPHKFLIAEALKKGKIYAWYPWQKMGLPFAGDIIAGWFYPLNLLYLTLPFEVAHRLFVFLHYPLAAIFMDLFLRKRGLDRYSSLLGGLAFSLSGYMVGQHGAVGVIIGPAWAPLALYFMDRALTGRIFRVFGVSGVLAIQIFAGEPQYAGITALLVSLMGIAKALNHGGNDLGVFHIAKRRAMVAHL
jgi:hypothetical protein